MSNQLKERTEQLCSELKAYIEAFDKKKSETKKDAFKGKVEEIDLFSEDEILDTAYNIFSNQQLYHMDIHSMEMKFRNTYENTLLLDPETDFDAEVKGVYNAIKNKHLKQFYLLEKNGSFKALDEAVIEKAKNDFKESIKKSNSLEYITQELERELKKIE